MSDGLGVGRTYSVVCERLASRLWSFPIFPLSGAGWLPSLVPGASAGVFLAAQGNSDTATMDMEVT